MKKFISFLTICTVVLITTGSLLAQVNIEKPGAVTPFGSTTDFLQTQNIKPGGDNLKNAELIPSLQAGGDRLDALQNNDGGWDWPLDDGDPNNASPVNTVGPIAMGLAQAYLFTNDAAHLSALTNAGGLLLSKTNNFSPSDGYLAKMLDQVYSVTTYSTHVNTNFYGPLASGTYDRNGAGTLYSTQSYILLIHNSRSSIPNLAAWDIGMGLVGAASCGVSGTELGYWIDGVKDEIDVLNGGDYYDVIGLAGAVYSLAFVGEDFNPTSGEHVAATNLNDLADILVSYQINNGGFAWNSGYVIPNDDNESMQGTAYAILALNEVDELGYQSETQGAVVYLVGAQLATGGWEQYSGSGENNEITGEALWAEAVIGDFLEVWVDDDFNSSTLGWGIDHFATIQEGIDAVAAGGTINVAEGTYTEQLHITTENLSIIGAGKVSTTIESPVTLTDYFTTGTNNNFPVVFVDGVTDFLISDLTVDGDGKGNTNYRFQGIGFWNSGGIVEDVDVLNIIDTPFSGAQHGVGIYSYNDTGGPYAISLQNVLVDDFQKTGVALSGDGVTIDLDNVTTNGQGATGTTAQNGIQVWGPSGTIDDCFINDIAYTGATYTATGLLVFGPGTVDADNVTIQGCQTSVYFIEGHGSFDNSTIYNVLGDAFYAYSSTAKNQSGIKVKPSSFDVDYISNGSKAGFTVNMDNCTITGNDAVDSWGVSALADGGEINMTISNNTITHWDYAIFAYDYGGGTLNVTALENDLSNNTHGFGTNITTKHLLDASYNWWGHATGPYHPTLNPGGQGSEIGDNILFTPWYTDPSMGPTSSDIDIAIYATSCSDFEVRLRALNAISNTTLTNVQFTLKWDVSYGVDLVNFATGYPLAQQGATVQSGGFNYAVFVGVDLAINNWVAGTEYTILSFNHDQTGTGTGDFVIGDDAWTTANNSMYYAELLGLDFTGINYDNALGVDLGLCPLYITGTFTANDKVYDGNTDATFLTNNLSIDGVKPGDVVTFDVVEIDFADENVGVDKLVSITLATITGADAAKYELFLTGAPTTLADITPKTLNAAVIGDPTKPYDGNTDASLASANYDITGLIAGETITITETFGTYASANVGIHLVTVNLDVPGDFTAGPGTLLTNYTLPTVATGNGTITAILLTVTAEDKTKVYDGAVFPYGNYTVTYSGFIPGEDETYLGGTLVYTGSAIAATAVGTWVITPGGYTSTNYTFVYVDGELEITAVTLGLTVMLQGPYNLGTSLMDTDLNPSQLPNGQPFNVAPWNYTGTEVLPGTLTDIVDWVLVELRSDASTMVGRCASLVYSDGTVSITIDDVNFPGVVAGSDYYIVIWHRNHMPVMSESAQTVPLVSYDLTLLANLYGTDPAIQLDGADTYGMIAGDVTANGKLKYSGPGNDRGPIIARIVAETGSNNTSGQTPAGYWQEDVNMNSVVLYIGAGNDRGFITDNLNKLTGSPLLNLTYTSVVPGAYTGSKDAGTNDGPFDLFISENGSEINIELETSIFIDNGMVDNIQFTLAWNVGDTEIENLLVSITSDFMLVPQGEAVEVDGIMHQVYVSVSTVYLPQSFNENERSTVLAIENTYGLSIADRLWIADDVFTSENNGMYYVSVWGTDHTGIIHTAALGMDDISNSSKISIYPNPVNHDVLYMKINTLKSEKLNIQIYDIQGKMMKLIDFQTEEVISNSLSIDVSDFTSGVYLINVIGTSTQYRDRFIVN